ncbi:MAG: hypothetical protein ACYDEA_01270 [Candidatus Dormibacteria bacterium]
MNDRVGLVHPEVAESAARLYRAHLEAVAGQTASAPARKALRDLIETTEAAQRLDQGLESADVTFTLTALEGVPASDRREFMNQYQLGLGYDGAKMVAMGTEAAAKPQDPEGLAYDCLQTALILSGSPESVVKSLLQGSSWWAKMEARGLPAEPWRPIHIHPNDFDQVQVSKPFHTWCNLARVVAPREQDWRDLMTVGASPGLGDLVYQIERSGLPAKRSLDGAPPTLERTDWLVEEVIPSLRKTAGILLIHGFGNSPAWPRNDLRLINAFLGYEPGTPTEVDWVRITPKRGDWLWSLAEGDHRVVWTRALGWPWRDEYMAAVRQAIA